MLAVIALFVRLLQNGFDSLAVGLLLRALADKRTLLRTSFVVVRFASTEALRAFEPRRLMLLELLRGAGCSRSMTMGSLSAPLSGLTLISTRGSALSAARNFPALSSSAINARTWAQRQP